jgi:hypothetical protein
MILSGKKAGVLLIFLSLSISVSTNVFSQTMPEILREGTLEEQMDHIHSRTIIYENFRAIREDMFQQIRRNSLDSLNAAKQEIFTLGARLSNTGLEVDSLMVMLQNTRNELNQANENRDNISFLGIPMVKSSYNMFVWSIIGGLALLLTLGLLLFVRNRSVTASTLSELKELKEEFEDYKKKTREQREKLVMEHFNEIKKYKEQMG